MNALIRDQIEYYDARAGEYDRTSTPPGDVLAPFGQAQVDALDRFGPAGDVLEIASGTGSWTLALLHHASHVTAVDASAEMIARARAKVGTDRRVDFVQADVLSWRPDRRFDVVFFANWLSHVPGWAFEGFWSVVAGALRPGGRVFFVDEHEDAWRHDALAEEFVDDRTSIVQRTLLDGRTFRVVKVFWNAHDLQERLRALGWDVEIRTVGPFYWAEGRRA